MPKLFLLIFFFLFQSTYCKQFYDPKPCSSPELSPGSRYTCTTSTASCRTFIVYRSRDGFDTVSAIATLFNTPQDQVLLLNNLSNPSQILENNREVLLPIHCSCSNTGYFQSNITYPISSHTTYDHISCDVFESLVKFPTLAMQNSYNPNHLDIGLNLTIPLKCACLDRTEIIKDGFQYLVTYPVLEFDDPKLIAEKFGISLGDMLAQNSLDQDPTLFTNTTLLIPLTSVPLINWNISDPSNRGDAGFSPTNPGETIGTKGSNKNFYVVGAAAGLFFVLLVLIGVALYCNVMYTRMEDRVRMSSSTRSSASSCLSPDLIAGVSKYSVGSYTVEELSDATGNFSKDTKLGASVHRGRIGGTEFVIKKMGFGDARRAISIHSKINHTNIVRLEGVCYGDTELSSSYLVFEFARNGCLRDCLRNPFDVLSWHRRTQIAFDVAIGLHYVHHCTTPSYVHMNISSRNILITEDWRAKIANLGTDSFVSFAPEYLQAGLVSAKADVFAFGGVLFELLSAKEARNGSCLSESLRFFGGGGGGGADCFEDLRGFLDPRLKDVPIGEALCMAFLAKACVEEDPAHRPSMNDILKILARTVR